MLSIKVPNESLTQLPSVPKLSKGEEIQYMQWVPEDDIVVKENEDQPLAHQLRLLALSETNVYLYSSFRYVKPKTTWEEVSAKTKFYLFGDYSKPWTVQKLSMSKRPSIVHAVSENSRWLVRLIVKQKSNDKENRKIDTYYLQRINLFPDGDGKNHLIEDKTLIEVPWLSTGSTIFVPKPGQKDMGKPIVLGISNDGRSILYCEPRGSHFYIWHDHEIVEESTNATGDWFGLPLTGSFPCHTNDSRTRLSVSHSKILSVRGFQDLNPN